MTDQLASPEIQRPPILGSGTAAPLDLTCAEVGRKGAAIRRPDLRQWFDDRVEARSGRLLQVDVAYADYLAWASSNGIAPGEVAPVPAFDLRMRHLFQVAAVKLRGRPYYCDLALKSEIDWAGTFHEVLRAWMDTRGLTPLAAATILDVPTPTLKEWLQAEAGRTCPYPKAFKALMAEWMVSTPEGPSAACDVASKARIDWDGPFHDVLRMWIDTHGLSRSAAGAMLDVTKPALENWLYAKKAKICPYPKAFKALMRDWVASGPDLGAHSP